MDTSFTNSREEVARAQLDTTDWAGLSRSEQIAALELEGYVLIPNVLSPETVNAVGAELNRLETTPVDYSDHQRGHPDVLLSDSPHSIGLIAHAPIVDFLSQLFGDELICTSCGYSLSEPGHPGIAIHTDSQPYGSQIFGMQASSPCLVRVLYYLDDLTRECSPFKVIPRSHLSLHADANPYRRYLSHPQERMVTCRAGSAVIINQKVFHGNYPNHSDGRRRLLAIAYRPAWAGPIDDVPDHDKEMISRLPQEVRPFFGSMNTRHIEYDLPNRPDDMQREAAGINPSRWNG